MADDTELWTRDFNAALREERERPGAAAREARGVELLDLLLVLTPTQMREVEALVLRLRQEAAERKRLRIN